MGNAGRPKQFLPLGRRPVVVRTLERFLPLRNVRSIVVVLAKKDMPYFRKVAGSLLRDPRLIAVCGGRERQDSVFNGFQALPSDVDVVLVHDGVRPLVERRLIRSVIRTAAATGAAVPALPLPDTVVEVSGTSHRTLDRDRLRGIQTPQGFRFQVLQNALEQARADGFYGTDESSLVERLGQPVTLVDGSEWNFKITTRKDLRVAELIFRRLAGR
ncbi:MAG: 2-C-methyl-D-erythritol 4-phosphate cytidylyltransferase [Acidobacteria bacterium]|nr:2-C-methyl-D-erythritol 4-phosphate cytidylyltransferase [Acidobacteriota bacterium]